MLSHSNEEVHKSGPGPLGILAIFIAGAGVATAVAIVAARWKSQRPGNAIGNVIDACDRAAQKLESRIQIAG